MAAKCSCGEAQPVKHVLIYSSYQKGKNILQAELSRTRATHYSLKSILGKDDWEITKRELDFIHLNGHKDLD